MVVRVIDIVERARALTLRYLPEHQIYLRSNDRVRLVRVGTRFQVMTLGFAALVAGWMSVATINTVADLSGARDDVVAAKETELARMQANMIALKADVGSLKGSVAATAGALQKRQVFLASLLSGRSDTRTLAALLPSEGPLLAEAGDTHPDVMAPFIKLEHDQLAFVDKATSAAEARYKDTQALLRRLGLNPARFVAQSSFAMGGPYIPATSSDSGLAKPDPKFKQLFVSWKKVDQLEKAMTAIPSFRPASTGRFTSGFGVRYDPFNGNAAMHAGVDLAGNYGDAIYAASDGVVTNAGWSGAYGQMIEIAHGKGIATRYGHLSRITARVGTEVKQGQIIGRMGSTGRSTGTHLHYEVRIDGRAVNPMPYLEASNYVLAIQERADLGQGGPDTPVKP